MSCWLPCKPAAEHSPAAVPYKDEVEFLQNSVQELLQQPGYFNAPEIQSFWTQWQQFGGWWNASAGLDAPITAGVLDQSFKMPVPIFDEAGDYYLFPFASPLLGDGSGANKPWLQETPDPTTTVMWNTWVEIHPDTADKLGLEDDDVVRITSAFGEVEAFGLPLSCHPSRHDRHPLRAGSHCLRALCRRTRG